MNGQISLERIGEKAGGVHANPHVHPHVHLHVHQGPLIESLLSTARRTLDEYEEAGGYRVARRVLCRMTPDEVISEVDSAGLRGRAGGGFPTGHKWWLVSRNEAREKYFICNANAVQPGGFKERFLIGANPHRIVEAALIGAFAVRAGTAFIFVPRHFTREAELLEEAVGEARARGFVGPNVFGSGLDIEVVVYRSLGGYITGEETALMEMIEGRVGRPRGKPPLPTSRGLFGAPTATNNIETLLNVHYIMEVGAERYRRIGTPLAPGTLIFSLSGGVNRPGLYELPLGTSLRELIVEYGQGAQGGDDVKAVFPGGVSSPALDASSLDVALDYDSLREAGSELGSGTVIVATDRTCMVEVAARLAEFFHESSCGKCQPCYDGTARTRVLLGRLDRLDEKSIDRVEAALPPSLRKRTLNVISIPAGISYTDTAKGLEKIQHLAEFFKYRGDCHHSTEAASSIQSLLALFRREFEHHRISPQCELGERAAYESIGA